MATIKDIVYFLSQPSGLTQEALALKLGYSDRANVAVPLSRNDGMGMRVETLIRWLDALDAQLVVQSIEREEEWVLDGESERF